MLDPKFEQKCNDARTALGLLEINPDMLERLKSFLMDAVEVETETLELSSKCIPFSEYSTKSAKISAANWLLSMLHLGGYTPARRKI